MECFFLQNIVVVGTLPFKWLYLAIDGLRQQYFKENFFIVNIVLGCYFDNNYDFREMGNPRETLEKPKRFTISFMYEAWIIEEAWVAMIQENNHLNDVTNI